MSLTMMFELLLWRMCCNRVVHYRCCVCPLLFCSSPLGPGVHGPQGPCRQHAVNYVCVLPLHAASLFPPLDSCRSLFVFALHLCPPSDLVPPGSLLCTAVLDGIRARSRNQVGSARSDLEYPHREHAIGRCGRHGVAAAACGLGVMPACFLMYSYLIVSTLTRQISLSAALEPGINESSARPVP